MGGSGKLVKLLEYAGPSNPALSPFPHRRKRHIRAHLRGDPVADQNRLTARALACNVAHVALFHFDLTNTQERDKWST